MPQQPPLYTTANGINRLAMSQEVSSSTRPGQNDFSPLPENDWTFTTVCDDLMPPLSRGFLGSANDDLQIAAALNVGIEILETPSGKAALKRLGEEVVRDWWRSRRYRFGGDVNRMSHYVDQFLAALRRDFPNIMIADLGGPNVLASTKRLGSTMWNGDLDNFLPKVCVGIYFNACVSSPLRQAQGVPVSCLLIMFQRVSDMVAAISGTRNAGSIRRYKHFLFMFGVATSHELCHAFVAYLSQNSQDDDSFTPPRVTHLNYASPNPNPTQAPLATGESGRWFENRLFGGSLEFYRDNRADERQVGCLGVLCLRIRRLMVCQYSPVFPTSLTKAT